MIIGSASALSANVFDEFVLLQALPAKSIENTKAKRRIDPPDTVLHIY
jgi:hypothetical protein